MSSVLISGDTSGSITISAPAVSGTNTLTLPAVTDTLVGKATTDTLTNKTVTAPVLSGSVTGTYTLAGTPTITSPTITGASISTMASSVITSGTAVASTSGTSIDFTGIPSWVKRITVLFSLVSETSNGDFLIQLGDSGGVETTGYAAAGSSSTAGVGTNTSTAGFIMRTTGASDETSGQMVICLLNSSTNLWASSHAMGTVAGATRYGGGSKSLSATLDRVRITTPGGVATFDVGTVNILYE